MHPLKMTFAWKRRSLLLRLKDCVLSPNKFRWSLSSWAALRSAGSFPRKGLKDTSTIHSGIPLITTPHSPTRRQIPFRSTTIITIGISNAVNLPFVLRWISGKFLNKRQHNIIIVPSRRFIFFHPFNTRFVRFHSVNVLDSSSKQTKSFAGNCVYHHYCYHNFYLRQYSWRKNEKCEKRNQRINWTGMGLHKVVCVSGCSAGVILRNSRHAPPDGGWAPTKTLSKWMPLPQKQCVWNEKCEWSEWMSNKILEWIFNFQWEMKTLWMFWDSTCHPRQDLISLRGVQVEIPWKSNYWLGRRSSKVTVLSSNYAICPTLILLILTYRPAKILDYSLPFPFDINFDKDIAAFN